MHFTRYQMYKTLFASLPVPLTGTVLGISGLKYWVGSKNYTPPQKIIADGATVTITTYPEVNICALPYPDNSFDYVISDQVFEHVEGDIQKAIDECKRVLKPGGLCIIGTVFINPIHYGPKDLWRFSPDALRYLCRDFSEIKECGSWGNRWTHILFFLYENARDWKIPNRRWSLRHFLATLNDPKYPLMTWIITKK